MRVSLIFDCGIGDLFVIKVAGNLCGTNEMGTVEYGVDHVGIPLLVIMGHSKCRAVTAVVKRAELQGNLANLAKSIEPAVERARAGAAYLEEQELIDEAARENVWHQIETLFANSDAVSNAVRERRLEVVGAFYNVEEGDVAWMDKHPRQNELLRTVG